MRKRNWQIPLFIVLFILSLTACGPNQENDSKMALIKTTNPDPVKINKGNTNQIQKIKDEISSFPEIYDVAVVKGKKDTLVAYKVRHMYRFKMKAIEKKVQDKLENEYPKEKFTVSSDYKIFLETVRLKDAINKTGYSKKKAEKRLQSLIELKDKTT